MRKLLFIQFLLFSLSLTAESQSPYTANEQFSRESKYVKVTLLMGNPIKIFISGKEAARINMSKLKVEVRPAKGLPWNELKLNNAGNYYEIQSQNDQPEADKILEVKTTLINKKSEVFEFELNHKQ